MDTSRTKTRQSTPFWFILIVITIIFLHQHFLIIKEITCQTRENPCPESVATILNRVKNRSFLRLNQRELEKQILATGLVDRVEFKTKLPGKLICQTEPPSVVLFVRTAFSPVKPSLNLVTSSTSATPSVELDSFVASIEGKTFQLLSTGALNQSDSDSSYYLVSQTIPGQGYLSKVFSWLHSLATSSMKPEKIYFLSDMIILKQNDLPDLIVNFSADPAEITLALQRLNQAITIKKPTIIDFRYSHPILK